MSPDVSNSTDLLARHWTDFVGLRDRLRLKTTHELDDTWDRRIDLSAPAFVLILARGDHFSNRYDVVGIRPHGRSQSISLLEFLRDIEIVPPKSRPSNATMADLLEKNIEMISVKMTDPFYWTRHLGLR